MLRAQITTAQQQALSEVDSDHKGPGITLLFESEPEFLLRSDSLDDRRAQIRLLSVKRDGAKQVASVFVPREAFAKLIRKIDDYESEEKRSQKGNRKNRTLIESISGIRLAIARDLWTDARPFPSAAAAIWWEIWLRDEAGMPEKVLGSFQSEAHELGLEVSSQSLAFPERVVTLIRAAPEDWNRSRLLLSEIAELRYPAEPATPYLDLSPAEQIEFITEAVERLRIAGPDAPAVCLLDTGVRRGHPLLESSLLEQDLHAVDPDWGTADHHHGLHGTSMAGNALHGCLTELFQTRDTIFLSHRLESVKILPPRIATRPELYGETVRQAAARVEIARPDRNRVLCMAVTDWNSPIRDGRPSSWSAGIDQLTWNDGMATRLLCVSTGNIRTLDGRTWRYLEANQCSEGVIEDPAQSWNALSVGAYAGRHRVVSERYAGWTPAAPFGGLTPSSRTTTAWLDSTARTWPYKPDIVMDGGNWATDGREISQIDDLALLTTGFGPSGPRLDTNMDTSAATALASRACAVVQASYPELRAETVRALLVHSARWTPQMEADCPGTGRGDLVRRIRTFGYGVPNLTRTLWSLRNEVTLVAEGAITPYRKTKDGVKHNQMAVHGLPWPSAVLTDLGRMPVTLRVTLSYFVEPSPGFRGWTKSFRYASHGLRFELRRPEEKDERSFLARLSKEAQDEDTGSPTRGSDLGWALGNDHRVRGSLHVDWWTGPACELARRDLLAIYPVTGWWRERPHLGKVETAAAYTLCLSIETPDQFVDLYTPIVTQTEVVTPISG